MKMSKRIILKKDITIPKGTVFEDCAGSINHYYHGMYDVIVALDKDTSAKVVVSDENKEYFEEVRENAKD